MAYNQGVPATGSSGSADYLAIQGNFAQLQTTFSANHKPISSGGGTEGFHTLIEFAAAQSAPNLVSPQSSLYPATSAGSTQLFFQNGALASNVVQLTGNATLSGSEYTVISPWGLTFKFGTATASPGGTANTFAVNFPTAVIGIVITVRAAGAQSNAAVITGANAYTAYCASGSQTIYFVAWGN
jgi:hypothetical protein